MNVLRGDAVIVSLQGDLKKPRPAVIVQSDDYNEDHVTLLACPLTSHLIDAPLIRPTIEPSQDSGLEVASQVMVNKMTAARRSAFGKVVGKLNEGDMARIEASLVTVLGLRQVIFPQPLGF